MSRKRPRAFESADELYRVLNFKIPESVARRYNILAASEGVSVTELYQRGVMEFIGRHIAETYNEETARKMLPHGFKHPWSPKHPMPLEVGSEDLTTLDAVDQEYHDLEEAVGPEAAAKIREQERRRPIE